MRRFTETELSLSTLSMLLKTLRRYQLLRADAKSNNKNQRLLPSTTLFQRPIHKHQD